MIDKLLALGALITVGSWQGIVLFRQSRERDKRYDSAYAHAEATGKPLLVAGGPLGITRFRQVFTSTAHGYGDVCLDIDRRAIAGCPCGMVADVRRMPFADKAFGAVFASHLLEHLPTVADAKAALAEFERVADAVFVVHPYRQSLMTWLIPSHHLCVWQKRDKIYLKQRNGLRSTGKKETVSCPNGANEGD